MKRRSRLLLEESGMTETEKGETRTLTVRPISDGTVETSIRSLFYRSFIRL